MESFEEDGSVVEEELGKELVVVTGLDNKGARGEGREGVHATFIVVDGGAVTLQFGSGATSVVEAMEMDLDTEM